MLTGERFKRAEEIFQAAVDLPPRDRAALVAARCKEDEELRKFVEELLHGDEGGRLAAPDTQHVAQGFESRTQDELPKRIGRYEILAKIGEGGMGVVYEARQDSPQRVVALKVIAPGLASPHLVRRFQFEADVLGQLQHPGIAHIYEAGTAQVVSASGITHQQPYFAMELVRGRTLVEYARTKQLSTPERLELMARVCDAVHHAHLKGVIHRDLKPGNILVVEESGERSHAPSKSGGPRTSTAVAAQPKILDFGVARAIDADMQTMTLHTDIGQLIGTVPYMSPEQVAGDTRQLDVRSDVYALGVILYELLAGKLPLDVRNRSIPEAARIIREEEPSRLSTVDTLFRGDVETIVSRAMEKEKERRYQSAAELAEDIRRYLLDEPIVARRATRMYQLRKFARRNKLLVGATAAVLAALSIGIVGTTWFAIREGRERKRAESALIESRKARDAEIMERQRAVRRLNQVRTLANTLIFKVYNEIVELPGSTQARQILVQTGLKYLDNLASESAGDVSLQKELASAYVRLGDVQGNNSVSNVGDTKGALESYEKAMALVEAMRKEHPDDRAVLRALCDAHSYVGTALRAVGRTAEAMAHFDQELAVMDSLVKRFPNDEQLQDDAALAAANIGRIQAAIGKLEPALENFRKYQKNVHMRSEAQPTDRTFRFNTVMIDSKIADLLEDMNRGDEALAGHRESLAAARKLSQDFPGDAGVTGLQAGLLTSFADYLDGHYGKTEEALPMYREALALRQRLSEADKKDVRAIRNLAVAYFGLGSAQQSAKQWTESLVSFEAARKGFEDTIKADPHYVVVQRDVALADDRLAQSLEELGRLEDALPHIRAYREAVEKLAKTDPLDALAREDLQKAYFRTGEYYVLIADNKSLSAERRVEQYREARQWLEKSRTVIEQMKKDGQLRPSQKDPVPAIRKILETCDRQIGELSKGGGEIRKPTSAPATNG